MRYQRRTVLREQVPKVLARDTSLGFKAPAKGRLLEKKTFLPLKRIKVQAYRDIG